MFIFKPKKFKWEKQFNDLATYNSEVARGIVHTEEYILKMQGLQKQYDEKMRHHYYEKQT